MLSLPNPLLCDTSGRQLICDTLPPREEERVRPGMLRKQSAMYFDTLQEERATGLLLNAFRDWVEPFGH